MLRYKASAYAVLAMYDIAKEQRGASNPPGVRAADIAKRYRLPKAYTAKILSQLANSGLLHSDRGPRGGYRLNRPANKVTMHDIFEGVGGIATDKMEATSLSTIPPAVDSTLRRARKDTVHALKTLFKKTSLMDILGKAAASR